MRVELLYGRGRLDVDFPENLELTTIRKQPMPVAADPAERLRESFRRTASGRSLRELARERRTACILICDITRPVPHGTLLPPLTVSRIRCSSSRLACSTSSVAGSPLVRAAVVWISSDSTSCARSPIAVTPAIRAPPLSGCSTRFSSVTLS